MYVSEGRISIRLVIEGDSSVVKSIRDSLEPDNRDLPQGTSLTTEFSDGRYVVRIEGSVSKISTILNMADEILELAKTAERLIK